MLRAQLYDEDIYSQRGRQKGTKLGWKRKPDGTGQLLTYAFCQLSLLENNAMQTMIMINVHLPVLIAQISWKVWSDGV